MTTIEGTVATGYEPVRDAFEANFRHGRECGAAVAIYRHGQPLVDLWAGVADTDTARPWQRDTTQVIYSATKSAPAACAHLLAQRGLLDIDAPVTRYWPEFGAAGKQDIPVRWLLSHQAGLPVLSRPVTTAEALAWDPVIELLAAQAPEWEPGTKHGYHSITYGWLVGEVIRRITGMAFGDFFAKEIAEPCGLDYWMGLPEDQRHRVARIVSDPADLPDPGDGPFGDPNSLAVRSIGVTTEPLDLNDPQTLAAQLPAVNGVCTARSLARFYAALIGEVDGVRLLNAETLAAATVAQADGIDEVLRMPTRPAVGFGLPLEDMPWWTPTAFGFGGHGGSLGFADPESGIAFGYVMNRLHFDAGTDPRAPELVAALRGVLD